MVELLLLESHLVLVTRCDAIPPSHYLHLL